MSWLDFFDYTFLKSSVWLSFGALYGVYLMAMAGVLLVWGSEQQRQCDSFIVSAHVADPGLNRYVRNIFPEGHAMLAEAGRAGCRVIYQRTEAGKDLYGIWQISKLHILYSRWFLSLTLGGLFAIFVAHYVYCLVLVRRAQRMRIQRPYA